MKSSAKKDISAVRNHLDEEIPKWFAIYTKYKCEKFVADTLGRKGIASYVPLIEKTTRYASGIKRRMVPLINTYVFVQITRKEYLKVLETQYVLGFLKQGKSLISIPQKEIDILKLVVGEIENIYGTEMSLNVGDEVEIVGGQLTGVRGRLSSTKGKNNFVIQLTSVGLQLEMQIPKERLRLVKKGRGAG